MNIFDEIPEFHVPRCQSCGKEMVNGDRGKSEECHECQKELGYIIKRGSIEGIVCG